jgi:hypothetical protein
MKMYAVPKKCLTDKFNNFGRMSAIDRSLCKEAFGDNSLRKVT